LLIPLERRRSARDQVGDHALTPGFCLGLNQFVVG
jgi:hypothetical protein